MPSLRNKNIPDDNPLIIIDDDITYKENIFNLLKNSIINNKDKISSMCYGDIEGYKGFGFIKKKLKGILNINIPNECIRIDDFIIQQ